MIETILTTAPGIPEGALAWTALVEAAGWLARGGAAVSLAILGWFGVRARSGRRAARTGRALAARERRWPRRGLPRAASW